MNIVKKLFGRGKGSSKSQVEKQPLTNTDVVAIALGKREAGNHHNNQHAISTAISTLGYDSELLSLVQTPNKYSKLAIENLTAKIDNNQVSLDQLKQDMPKLSDQLRIVSYCKNENGPFTKTIPLSLNVWSASTIKFLMLQLKTISLP